MTCKKIACCDYEMTFFGRMWSRQRENEVPMKQPLIFFLVVIFCTLASVSSGDNLEDAIEAFNFGDFKKAFELYLIEAKNGNASAQTNLGTLYAIGKGVPKDDKEAVKWFHKAALQGEVIAQSNLGAHYAKGQGVSKDDKEAVKWFTLAAKQGDSLSQLSLGIMYDVGRGVSQNHVVAWAWYTLARENGEEIAQGYIDIIQGEMSLNEISMAKQIAEQFRTEIGD
jgi:TPR repeat protein